MTHHYSIEIISKKIFLKATYRNKKFRKFEHIRGAINRELMDSLGRIIPVSEDEISELNKLWFKKVNYQIEIKQAVQSLNKRFVDSWFFFYESLMEMKPKYTGADGIAINQIIAYLKAQCSNEDEAFATWQLILDNWGELNDFHQSQLDLKYINSKLNVIIREIKKKNNTNISGTNRSVEL